MKKDEKKERILERKRISWEGMFYSIQRIDLLIVAISGGGIYVCMETIKFLAEKEMPIHWMIKISGAVFLLSLLSNLIGQILGQKANEFDFLMCESKLDNDSEDLINRYDLKASQYSTWTIWMTYISLAVMSVGLIFLLIYFSFIFSEVEVLLCSEKD
jgi:magnesium-transporting ATPase (P-type)